MRLVGKILKDAAIMSVMVIWLLAVALTPNEDDPPPLHYVTVQP